MMASITVVKVTLDMPEPLAITNFGKIWQLLVQRGPWASNKTCSETQHKQTVTVFGPDSNRVGATLSVWYSVYGTTTSSDCMSCIGCH